MIQRDLLSHLRRRKSHGLKTDYKSYYARLELTRMNSDTQNWTANSKDWTCNQFTVFSTSEESQIGFLKRALNLIEELRDIDILDVSVHWYWTRDTPDGVLEQRGEVSLYFTRDKDE